MPETLSCPHGYASPKSCIDCMEDGPVELPKAWQRVGDPFTAHYFGRDCPCGRLVEEGQTIQRWDLGDEATVYTHARCRP